MTKNNEKDNNQIKQPAPVVERSNDRTTKKKVNVVLRDKDSGNKD